MLPTGFRLGTDQSDCESIASGDYKFLNNIRELGIISSNS